MILIYIVICCSLAPLSAAAISFICGKKLMQRLASPLSLIAVGILLALSFGHLLPEAMEQGQPHEIGLIALMGIIVLCALEMFFNSHHHHQHALLNGGLGLLCGSFFHTLTDGIIICSALLTSTELGIAVSVAILSHEIAHELGDYAIFIEQGMSSQQAYVVNLTALLGMLTGGIFSYLILNKGEQLIPYALGLSAASFIYVALSDLLPRLRHSDSKILMLKRLILIILGMILALLLSAHEH